MITLVDEVIMTTNRERLLELKTMLDTAPFDVRGLRAQLSDTSLLTEAEAGDLMRHALTQLSRAGFALSWVDTGPLPARVEEAHRQALAWVANARSVLMDHSLN